MTNLHYYTSFVPVVDAAAVSDSEIDVVFANGRRARIDLSDIIGQGPWKCLSDPEFFRLAHAAYDTVIWTDEIDLAPENVWERAQS